MVAGLESLKRKLSLLHFTPFLTGILNNFQAFPNQEGTDGAISFSNIPSEKQAGASG